MIITIKSFGIAAEICGSRTLKMEVPNDCSVEHLKELLANKYPALSELLSYRIAVNHVYELDAFLLKELDEVAIIPPVSGG